jgi:hypothetical protein
VNRIYLEPRVMALPVGGHSSPALPGSPDGELPATSGMPTPIASAVEALGHLAESYELVVLGDPPRRVLEAFEVPIVASRTLPVEPAHGSWLITDDPTRCTVRPPGLKTILVGPRRAPTNKPTPRCDVEARDLNAAVVEILTRQAMS